MIIKIYNYNDLVKTVREDDKYFNILLTLNVGDYIYPDEDMKLQIRSKSIILDGENTFIELAAILA